MSAARLALQHPLIRGFAKVHVLWKGIDWNCSSEDEAMANDRREETSDIAEAQVISSGTLTSGWHRPMLDLDVPAVLVPSSTPGHSHLYIDKVLTWEQYERLLEVLDEVGILEHGYVEASKRRRCTFLRLPWVKKGHEQLPPELPTVEEVDAYLASDVDSTAPLRDPWADPDPVPF